MSVELNSDTLKAFILDYIEYQVRSHFFTKLYLRFLFRAHRSNVPRVSGGERRFETERVRMCTKERPTW